MTNTDTLAAEMAQLKAGLAAENAALKAEIAKLKADKSSSKPATCTESVFVDEKGVSHPMLEIRDGYPLKLGVGKCRKIITHFEAIKKFAAKHIAGQE